ncbi:hypothetical protein P5673_008947 [Acropora cervicornis]|uniref:Uncharacterized protein n=1 Tax=Acropora cervicornis TaxID=6130 RepID=A0AAD9QTL2_ACRCE|nr:hypothetical protein P5673_008947 [Acropora cervicornis]
MTWQAEDCPCLERWLKDATLGDEYEIHKTNVLTLGRSLPECITVTATLCFIQERRDSCKL